MAKVHGHALSDGKKRFNSINEGSEANLTLKQPPLNAKYLIRVPSKTNSGHHLNQARLPPSNSPGGDRKPFQLFCHPKGHSQATGFSGQKNDFAGEGPGWFYRSKIFLSFATFKMIMPLYRGVVTAHKWTWNRGEVGLFWPFPRTPKFTDKVGESGVLSESVVLRSSRRRHRLLEKKEGGTVP